MVDVNYGYQRRYMSGAALEAKKQKTEELEWWKCGKCGLNFSLMKGGKTKTCPSSRRGCGARYTPGGAPNGGFGTVHTPLPGEPQL